MQLGHRGQQEQPDRKARRAIRATRLPIPISPLSSLPRLKVKKEIPERRGLKEILVTQVLKDLKVKKVI